MNIAQQQNLPKYLYRSDGKRFTLQLDGAYTKDATVATNKWGFSYESLIGIGLSEIKPIIISKTWTDQKFSNNPTNFHFF